MNYQRVPSGDLPSHTLAATDHGLHSDEISLSDLLRTLWRGRGLIVLLPIIAMVIAALAMIATALRVDYPTLYYVKLNGIENGQYPNGTAFSPQDLIATPVLAGLRRQYDLPEGVNLNKVINVTYGNPATEGLTRAYRDRLSAPDLSVSDTERINEIYQRQLDAAIRSMLRIEVDHSRLNADAATGAVIAHAVPEIWSDHFSQNVRIFQDTGLANASIPRTDETLENTASVLAAKQSLEAMESGLAILAGDNRLSLIQSSDGYSVEDLQQELRRFKTVSFDPLISGGISADDGVGSAYVADLQVQLNHLRRKLQSYDESLRELRNLRLTSDSSGAVDGSAHLDPNSVQLAESGLSEILQLAERASFSDYVQDLLSGRQKVAFQISDLEREMEMVTAKESVQRSPLVREQASQALDALTRRYTELLDGAQARLRARVGALYTPATSPMQLGSILPDKTVLAIVLAGGLGALLGIFIVLIRASLRNENHRDV